MIAKELHVPSGQLIHLAKGCLLHYLGLLFVKDEPDEEKRIRQHTRLGFELLKTSDEGDILVPCIAHEHHEHQGGTGLPSGLKGSNIVFRNRCQKGPVMTPVGEIAAVADTFGGLDVAVANAGFGVSGTFVSLKTGDFRRQLETNVFGAIDTAYATLPHLVAPKGRLVLISSVAGHLGTPTGAAYSASKFVLWGLAESIYYELADEGVSVTCINPRFVTSEVRGVDNDGVYHGGKEDPAPAWLVMLTEKAAAQSFGLSIAGGSMRWALDMAGAGAHAPASGANVSGHTSPRHKGEAEQSSGQEGRLAKICEIPLSLARFANSLGL